MSVVNEPAIPLIFLDLLRKAFVVQARSVDMGQYLWHEEHAGKVRNRRVWKTVVTDTGEIVVEMSRTWPDSFEPQLIVRYQSQLPDIGERVVSIDARGMCGREISACLCGLYIIDMSPELLSNLTDAELDEVGAWWARPFGFFDDIRFMIRNDDDVSRIVKIDDHIRSASMGRGCCKLARSCSATSHKVSLISPSLSSAGRGYLGGA
jgi:transposase-like protein